MGREAKFETEKKELLIYIMFIENNCCVSVSLTGLYGSPEQQGVEPCGPAHLRVSAAGRALGAVNVYGTEWKHTCIVFRKTDKSFLFFFSLFLKYHNWFLSVISQPH